MSSDDLTTIEWRRGPVVMDWRTNVRLSGPDTFRHEYLGEFKTKETEVSERVKQMTKRLSEEVEKRIMKALVFGQTEEEVSVSFLPEVVRVARAVQDFANQPSQMTVIPAQLVVTVPGKGFRRKAINSGTYLKIRELRVGKNVGLLFVFEPCLEMNAGSFEFDTVEMSWREFCDTLPDAFETIQRRIFSGDKTVTPEKKATFFPDLDEEMTVAFHKNAGMQKMTIDGLKKSLEERAKFMSENPPEKDRADFGIF
jgi:hypothetical protein